jgi:hypothetical protein
MRVKAWVRMGLPAQKGAHIAIYQNTQSGKKIEI